MTNRTTATQFFSRAEILQEIIDLRFAVASLVELSEKGSHAYENAENATLGIEHRLDYLHDSISLGWKPQATK
jgi:hypothetical protein